MTDDLVAASEALAVWDTRENYFALPKEDRDALCAVIKAEVSIGSKLKKLILTDEEEGERP